MLTDLERRRARLDDGIIAAEMLALSTKLAQHQAQLRDALDRRDRARVIELVADCKRVQREYEAAAARRRAVKRRLAPHRKEDTVYATRPA